VVILRIKQAQLALSNGRLDEAFELAAQSDVQAHREGQELISPLVQALVQRGEAHLAAERFGEALADCDKALRLGGNLPAIGQLRTRIAEASLARQRQERGRVQIAAAVRDHLENGRLTLGEGVLAAGAQAGGAGREAMESLQRELAGRRADAQKALELAQQAMDREDIGLATDELIRARRIQAPNSHLMELTSKLLASVTERIRSNLELGRLDLARSVLDRTWPLAERGEEMGQFRRILDDCARARERVGAGRHREAAQILRRLSLALPGAEWLSASAGRLEQAAGLIEATLGGALGLSPSAGGDGDGGGADAGPGVGVAAAAAVLAVGAGGEAVRQGPAGPAPAPPCPAGGEASPAGPEVLPAKFLMLVDGVGSYLVSRPARVTIGPVSSSGLPDLGLLADPNLPMITIERVEEDYFLRCDRAVMVNDKPTTNRLLADGDAITLSAGRARCRIRFGLPNPASVSAVLTLSGARLPRSDVRQIVLLGREMILGPGAGAHVRADGMDAPATLHLRDGKLMCRGGGAVTVDGRAMDDRLGIPMGAAVRIGTVSLVLAKA
jgi:tetratricopeptide (TPR) repeat protein